MPSIVCVVVHPSRIVREGLTSMLATSPFEPACTASSTEDVPSAIAGAGEQVLVLIGVRKGSDLAEALSAAKAGFPDAHLVVFGDSGKHDFVTAALALGATSFVDENIATSALVKELELVALGEPVVSVYILKQLLGSAVEVPQPANTQEEAEQNLPLCAVEVPQPQDTQGQAEQKLPLCAVEVPQPANTQGHAEQKLPLCAVEVSQPANTQGQAEQKLPLCAVEVSQPANTQGQVEQKLPLCAVEVPQLANIQGQAEQKPRLSGREAAILDALVEGASNKLIACQLKITEATVKVHVKAILRKIRGQESNPGGNLGIEPPSPRAA